MFLRRSIWECLRWAGFAVGITYSILILSGEYHLWQSGKSGLDLLKEARLAAKLVPFDHRFRDRPVRVLLDFASQNPRWLPEARKEIVLYLRTEPDNIELWWNLSVIDHRLGDLKERYNDIHRLHEIVPHNAIVSDAYDGLNDP